MSFLKKTFRFLGGGAVLVSISLLAASRPVGAVPLRIWMPLQSVGSNPQPGMLQPLIDGDLQVPEYANGIKIELNDFSNSVPNGNGKLFVSLSGNADFPASVCLAGSGSACKGGTLFLGLQVHAQTLAVGAENGTVIVYIDAARQNSLVFQSCKDANNSPTTRPAPEDRKIQITYVSRDGQAAPTLSVREYKGDCQTWKEITPPGLDPLLEAWIVQVAARETAGANGLPSFLSFEMAITAQPRGWPFHSSQIAEERIFGLGVLHSLITPVALGSSFGGFPSIFTKPPTNLDTWSWATMDLTEPQRIDLAMTAYNVGQLQIVGDGGLGEARDFAQLTFRNDIICMVEQMNAGERNEVVKEINTLRAANGLDLMTPIYPNSGTAPNNMILAAGPILDSDWVRYGDLPEVSAYCAKANGECAGSGEGYKGIVWARIGVKKSKPTPRGKPQTWFGDHFVDVFCTHTQADYNHDGQFAHPLQCEDTLLLTANTTCFKSPNGPSENPWQANVREEQWKALKNWTHTKRTGGNGTPNGLDRPAFVLGDLNQIGPKGVSFEHPNEDIVKWIASTSGKSGFGEEYAAMRERLGILQLSSFDKANGWAWHLYDLLARNVNGTWIGQRTESGITDTSADDCMAAGKTQGYNTLTMLPREARLDYILVLPAEQDFPFYSLAGPSNHPAEPELDINANAGNWTDGTGCASDHAQVSARIGLVQTAVKANYNPNKKHRVTYRVSHLWDYRDADSGDTDWYVNDNDFEIELLDSQNAVLSLHTESFTNDSTPDGVAVPVAWSDSMIASGTQKVRAGVWITDDDWPSADDLYDGTSFPGVFYGPHFEFDHAYPGIFRLIGNFDTITGTTLGTADASALDPDGSCAHGCLGVKTEGNNDQPGYDVRVTQNIQIEEVP